MSLPFVTADEINTVVLVVSDSFWADTAAERMPFLQQLSDESVSFESCYAVGPHTPSSMSGMMQSRLPIDGGYGSVLPQGVPTLGEALESAGVTCGGWHCNPHTLTERGFDRGFGVYSDLLTQPLQYRPDETDETTTSSPETWRQRVRNLADRLGVRTYVDTFAELLKRRGLLASDPLVPAEQLVDASETYLANVEDESRFAYLHFMDTHMPYDPPDTHWSRSELDRISSRRAHVLYRRMKDDDHDLTDAEIDELRCSVEPAFLLRVISLVSVEVAHERGLPSFFFVRSMALTGYEKYTPHNGHLSNLRQTDRALENHDPEAQKHRAEKFSAGRQTDKLVQLIKSMERLVQHRSQSVLTYWSGSASIAPANPWTTGMESTRRTAIRSSRQLLIALLSMRNRSNSKKSRRSSSMPLST